MGWTSGGALVEVYGANFNLATPTDVIGDEPVPGVEVRFGSSPAAKIAVPRRNLIRVVTPPSPLPFDPTITPSGIPRGNVGYVDVTVTNLDSDGVPIPEESVTLPNGYAYVMPRLDSLSEGSLERANKAMIEAWRRSVCPNVKVHQSVEYDSQTGDMLNLVDIAQLPAIALLGPATTENRIESETGEQTVDPTMVPGLPPEERFMVAREPFTLDLVYDVIGMTASRGQLLTLMSVATRFIHQTNKISILRDLDDPSKGYADFEFDFVGPDSTFNVDQGVNNSDFNSFSGSVIMKAVPIERIELPGDAGVDAVPLITSINVEYVKFTPEP